VITILLADDHAVVRHGLRMLLEAESDFQIIGETGDGLEAVQMAENLQPNILVLDIMMNGINGIEVARQVSKCSPKTNIIILSMHGNGGYVVQALQAGAKAYVLKESTADELVRAIREVMAGRRYLSPPLSQKAIETYLHKTAPTALDPFEILTSREREVLNLTLQGDTSSEIARRLAISRRTVEIHRGNMMRKLGLRTQNQLLRYAAQRGILPADNGERITANSRQKYGHFVGILDSSTYILTR